MERIERIDFENALCAKLEDIRNFYRQYNPEAFNEGTVYLYMSIGIDTIDCNNAYWKKDRADSSNPVHFWKRDDREIYHAFTKTYTDEELAKLTSETDEE